ncbi:MAG: F0F1 ATP synthase subunit B [Arenicellales bacterium WSBS_2016_MAG_OTU3]
MNLNMTLIGQLISFAVFVWFCMKFVWPPIMGALDERSRKIADGLAAAEKGQKAHAEAEIRVEELVVEARGQARGIVANAEKHGAEVVEEARQKAKDEADRIIVQAKAEVEQEVNRAREALRGQLGGLASTGAGRILNREIDDKAHADLIDDLVAQL